MSDEEIRALAITAANQTPLGLLSNMEARTVLEFLRDRGNLVSNSTRHVSEPAA